MREYKRAVPWEPPVTDPLGTHCSGPRRANGSWEPFSYAHRPGSHFWPSIHSRRDYEKETGSKNPTVRACALRRSTNLLSTQRDGQSSEGMADDLFKYLSLPLPTGMPPEQPMVDPEVTLITEDGTKRKMDENGYFDTFLELPCVV
ncbi:hypothetical protein N7451_012342 [Penicillium sp. IBT 35674x]|nr:hypothetical protein N7451_012342 [Penicillium sp. IBT 35674x]